MDDLEGHRRMRACLEGIRHLDPIGVERRIGEFDCEIARLETLLGATRLETSPGAPQTVASIEIVPIGAPRVKAA